MTAVFILNPYANRGTAGRRKDEAMAALRKAGLDVELRVTERPGHGTELAYRAVLDGHSSVIAAGGDGSISEVVNGMIRAADEAGTDVPPIGILPLGSANDLMDNLKLPERLDEAANVIATGRTRRLDLGQVNGRYFDNNSAVGLEPSISLIQQRIRHVHGTPRYILATLRGIVRNPSWTMDLEWDGGEYSGPITAVTVGNCARTGGIFYVTPHADPFDGRLTFAFAYMPTRRQLLRVLPRTTRPGRGSWVEHPSVREVHTPWLKIRAEQPTPLHADGEILSPNVHDVEYRVIPGRLPIFMPEEHEAT
jgi:diacylglycerol kinase (ATP)